MFKLEIEVHIRNQEAWTSSNIDTCRHPPSLARQHTDEGGSHIIIKFFGQADAYVRARAARACLRLSQNK